MKSICLLGASGQLGKAILEEASFLNQLNFITPDSAQLNLLDKNSIQNYFSNRFFDVIINCAAYTAVDLAETESEKNNALNHLALAYLEEFVNAPIIHVSTDFVFDGSQSLPYKETDSTNPLQAYGKSKLLGEACIQNGVIIRTSWLYSVYGNNFVKTMLRLGKEREQIHVVANQLGSPTYANDLALVILNFANNYSFNGKKEIFHYSNEGIASWYDFAQSIMEYANLSCKVMPIPAANYPTPAQRPHYSVMDKTKIKESLSIEIPYWRESLHTCIEKLKNHED